MNESNEAGCYTYNVTECYNVTEVALEKPDWEKGATLLLIVVLSFVGNVCTIAMISRFKIKRVPDVLVIGLALTDLLATCFPVPMAIYTYLSTRPFSMEVCDVFATIAHLTRYSSAQIVTLVAVERFLAVNKPFFYRRHVTPKRFCVILVVNWFLALALAVFPALHPSTCIMQHTGYCIFSFTTTYALVIVAYSVVQFVVVFVCFVTVVYTLVKVYHRRKKMTAQGDYNKRSRARERDMVSFTKPNITSRISDLGKSLKKAAPIITEKLQLSSVEGQFARMLLAVVVLFYASWTLTVVLIVVAYIQKCESGGVFEDVLFWGIRFTVISTALNPFLYGILARQYRMAYWYVLKLCLSKCCPCVKPPATNVFAAARTQGGEIRKSAKEILEERRRKHRYNTGTYTSYNGSVATRNSLPILTRSTTRTYITGYKNLFFDDLELSTIQENSVSERSMHLPLVGELSSSVVIPHQARDAERGFTVLKHKGHWSSTEEGIAFRSPVSCWKENGNGSKALLDPAGAKHVLLDTGSRESEVALEEGKAHGTSPALKSGKVYANPVFEPNTDSPASVGRLVSSITSRNSARTSSSRVYRNEAVLVDVRQSPSLSQISSSSLKKQVSNSSRRSWVDPEVPATHARPKPKPEPEPDTALILEPTPNVNDTVLELEPESVGELQRLSDGEGVAATRHPAAPPSAALLSEATGRGGLSHHGARGKGPGGLTDPISSPTVATGSECSVQELRMRFESVSPSPPPHPLPPALTFHLPSDPIGCAAATGHQQLENSDSGNDSMTAESEQEVPALAHVA